MHTDNGAMVKVVVLGARGDPAVFLGSARERWAVEDFKHTAARGDPPIECTSCHVWRTPHSPSGLLRRPRLRLYFFGFGLAPADFTRLGAHTRAAMFTGADHIVALSSRFATLVPSAFPSPRLHVPPEGAGAEWLEAFGAEVETYECAPRAEVVERIVSMNLQQVSVGVLEDSWELLLSPLWEQGPDGNVVRRVFVAPSSMRAHYFEGPAAEALRHPRIVELVELVMRDRRRLEGLHALYCDDEAPVLPLGTRWSRDAAEVSLCLAEIARCARAGATVESLLAGERPAQRLRELETDFLDAVAQQPLRQLVGATARSVLAGR